MSLFTLIKFQIPLQIQCSSDEEKGFNQTIVYGRDISIDEVIGHAKRFPMMSEFQVILLRKLKTYQDKLNN